MVSLRRLTSIQTLLNNEMISDYDLIVFFFSAVARLIYKKHYLDLHNNEMLNPSQANVHNCRKNISKFDICIPKDACDCHHIIMLASKISIHY